MSKVNSAIAGAGAGAQAAGPWGAVAGGAAGYLLGKDDNSESYFDQMLKEAQSIPLPILKEYYPELYKQVASLNPELETAITLGPSEMDGIATDPSLRQAQLNALSKLQEVGDAGGRDAQFIADASRLENDVNTNLQGQQGAISQNMAARGISGGGSELVAKNMAAQNASNKQAQLAMDLNAQAQQRALQAIMQGGQLGGQIQNQDFNQASQKAQAADAINRFNTQNQQQVISNNVGAKNQAQEYNVKNAQNISNQNIGIKNQAQEYNNDLSQRQYDNELKKKGLINTAYQGSANSSANASKNQDQFVGGLIDTAGKYYAQKDKK